ncbi:MAG: hypothetical protein A2599_02795 [Candidatus Staskawiczbacteria bacterium RIFOXYD1_FULL_39_28]|uniref:DUF5681 domain-containing protein n=1 Tax=Candidatus Staskawiczbacteria bacterium RIFOXYC1_FULL_38_18 TaxID=1802229 RepID=A0A1G2JC19_9BACT|nr:MAG: hypothetical protein A2401_01295 [Candidatus Staskawiczbacteria bacterium RIFOXYC1_FULL_38_18]OGZ91038.1 MAG: hypothetical protein A2599_02795 [Candidatus Staskawiczbacteria bacterium RIFOXYD1_FULL_39_28]
MLEDSNELNQEPNKIEAENLHSSGGFVDKPERDEQGRFVNGHPKLGGTRMGYLSLRKVLREMLQEAKEVTINDRKEQRTRMEILLEVLFKKAVGGDLGAIREIFDRIEGKPKPLGVNDMPDEINLTQVFQQIYNQSEEARRQKEEENNLENKIK